MERNRQSNQISHDMLLIDSIISLFDSITLYNFIEIEGIHPFYPDAQRLVFEKSR